ncbi:uncharacterized protein LOC130015422 [Mercurialis annua]|uniref:uncharacterized protein LOC130015422 n=1 Tax=Mercurialis annua TaxID=3986 RepID=UPI0024AF4B7C|nr:uncharacterized protein LOC130015422 [Mercurialis annua]
MSDQILPEIVSNILSRCDVATIGRCKCISKQWRGIIESTHFMKLQLDYATNTNSAAAVFFFKELFDETLFQTPMSNLDMRSVPTISQVRPFSLIGSCNGLLLIYGLGYDSLNDDYKVVRIAHKCVPGRTANGLFVGGVLHWLMAKYNHGKMLLILGYDVGTDEIRELPLPDLKDELKEFK